MATSPPRNLTFRFMLSALVSVAMAVALLAGPASAMRTRTCLNVGVDGDAVPPRSCLTDVVDFPKWEWTVDGDRTYSIDVVSGDRKFLKSVGHIEYEVYAQYLVDGAIDTRFFGTFTDGATLTLKGAPVRIFALITVFDRSGNEIWKSSQGLGGLTPPGTFTVDIVDTNGGPEFDVVVGNVTVAGGVENLSLNLYLESRTETTFLRSYDVPETPTTVPVYPLNYQQTYTVELVADGIVIDRVMVDTPEPPVNQ